ncbi:ATP-binding cassette domain-containing protein [Pseudohoeflea sp. DP4N28-3]|uniref:ATP-binding cassette domain-containing protein n=1 Tax=Pseudohoeflea coraliihabitans TaxID=2860393 RepID=A0ABS6WJ47_9HYPH|nr:ATP-binding cassette domain-containing protein [Pseudohoeflea sp. DP4N28-3]MBW3095964.1 ATP-binding cassette domain-containing protein [Pseudohoeflea sp. DP4N28-3]
MAAEAVTVRYGEVTALSAVSTRFEPGRIHAVLGQNGAGKTTFARVAAGLVPPAEGAVTVFGRRLAGGDVAEARGAGVELVHQSFALPPSFTVAEVLQFVGPKAGLFTKRGIERHWQRWLDGLGLGLDARARIRDLPIEMQQSAEIARAMVSDARLLILDEPTAVLSPKGTERLFARVRELKAQGVTIMLVLHKIREVLAIADTVTVLRGGELVAGPVEAQDLTSETLAELIIGEAAARLDASDRAALVGAGAQHQPDQGRPDAPPAVVLKGISTASNTRGNGLSEVDLTVRCGEIVGIAGVEGNGQRELVAAIAGLEPLTAGEISLADQRMETASLAARREAGLRIIPFERNVEGLSLSSPLWENWGAAQLVGGSLLASVRPRNLQRSAEAAFQAWDVVFSNTAQPAGSLSGGNAQKVILSREMDPGAKLILAAQPTRGLDIGATMAVWKALRQARGEGAGILLVSSDLDELFDICDRVAVMVSGRVVAEFAPPWDLKAVGRAMTAAGQQPALEAVP